MKVISWVELRKVGHSKIIQGTIFVPIFGYLILFSQWFLNFVGEPDGFKHLWKIYIIYYGFVTLAIGSIIYNLRCPRIIKTHGFMSHYVSSVGPLFEKFNFSTIIFESIEHIKKNRLFVESCTGANARSFYRELMNIHDNEELEKQVLVQSPKIIEDGRKTEYLIAYYLINSELHLKSRAAVQFLYLFGFVLIAIPSIAMLIEVSVNSYYLVENVFNKHT